VGTSFDCFFTARPHCSYTAVIARAILSVRLSVRHVPVLSRQMKITIVRSSVSVSDRIIILVSRESFSGYSQGITLGEGVKVQRLPVASENLTYNQL